MIDEFINRNARVLITLFISILLIVITGYWYYTNVISKKTIITVAAGNENSESYKIMKALETVVDSGTYDFEIKVIRTNGSVENRQLLKDNLVQMATLQADLPVEKNVRLVANLYEEVFHLIFKDSSKISSIEELAGYKIALLTRVSGESSSFDNLRSHFELKSKIFSTLNTTWGSSTWLFNHGDIDAIFRVAEPNNEQIRNFINNSKRKGIKSETITQAQAISLKFPMYHKTIIPRGSYSGIPPNPSTDVETLGVDKLLVATEETPAHAITAIVNILLNQKRELIKTSKVAGLTKVPSEAALIPWHRGLEDYVNKEKPSFIQQNAEFLAFILSIFLLLGSNIIRIINRSKHQKINAYNEQLLSIKINVEQTSDLNELLKLREEHNALVNQIVKDAVNGKISSDGFEFFAFGWDSVTGLINDKENRLRNGF